MADLDGEWQLLLLGGGPLRAELAACAESLGIEKRVVFLDQVPSMQMPSLYHQIDVLALPSLTRPNWKEQFGRVLVEAMCSGVPVVGSDSGAIPAIVGDAGLIVPEGDPVALAHAFLRLRHDLELYARSAAAGRLRAEHLFTHKAVAEATVSLYRKLLSAEVAAQK